MKSFSKLIFLLSAVLLFSCKIYALDVYINHIRLEIDLSDDREIHLIIKADIKENIDFVADSLINLDKKELGRYLYFDNENKKQFFKIPYTVFLEIFKRKSIELLFSKDRRIEGGWRHIVSSPAKEDIYSLSLWFTGVRENYRVLTEVNGLKSTSLEGVNQVFIPDKLLLPVFKSRDYKFPYLITVRSFQPRNQDRELLKYGKDSEGEYAIYELQKGEALYSAVVVRFTGMTHAEDVLCLADIIADRSKIRRVDDIPVGYKVKIPLEYLLPEFLPENSQERQEYLEFQNEILQYSRDIKVAGLKNVHIILDAGHGGIDPGAVVKKISEHEVVYDIMCRLKGLIESNTSATVHPTIKDRKRGFKSYDGKDMTHDRNENLLTDPVYDLSNSKIGVNLRWYKANYIFEKLKSQNVPEENIVFISIHADHLYATLSGSMIYIADSRYLNHSRYGLTSSSYKKFKEYRHKPAYSFSRKARLKSQALSQNLAKEILLSLENTGINIYPNLPLRGYIIRGKRKYVPAVLRYNIIPTKILIEIGNLNNKQDRGNMVDHRFRQSVAEAILNGIADYFDH